MTSRNEALNQPLQKTLTRKCELASEASIGAVLAVQRLQEGRLAATASPPNAPSANYCAGGVAGPEEGEAATSVFAAVDAVVPAPAVSVAAAWVAGAAATSVVNNCVALLSVSVEKPILATMVISPSGCCVASQSPMPRPRCLATTRCADR